MNIGTIIQWASNTIPTGWLLCDGSAVSRTDYSALFGVIGTTFGSGNGSTTFNLPDLKGRVPVGKDANDTDFDTLGETGGEKTQYLRALIGAINGNIASIGHQAAGPVPNQNYVYGFTGNTVNIDYVSHSTTVVNTEGENPTTVQPYQVVNYIIKATTPDTIKISELNEITTLDDDDLIPVVDTSADETKKITKGNLIKFGKLLWTGNFTSGSITVNELSNYSVFLVALQGGIICLGTVNYGGTVIGGYATYTGAQYSYRFSPSGNTLSIDNIARGGSDGTQNVAVTEIYGLF